MKGCPATCARPSHGWTSPPVVQDNQYRIWNARRNRFWPALYLLDRQGRVVYRHYGEGDYARTESEIQRLLASP